MTAAERLASGRPLLADGATGTLLYARGAPLEGSFDLLNVTQPDLVRQVHQEYILAGAELITTNTFGANRIRLAAHGLADRVREINVQGVKVARNAREVAGLPVFIAGDIGPAGKPLEPVGPLTEQELLDAYCEQVEALLTGGVDLFVIETMSDPRELVVALQAVRRLSGLPVTAEMSFSAEGCSAMGATPRELAEVLAGLEPALRPEVLGVNCGAGPAPVLEAVQALKAAGGGRWRLSAMPNAGLPTLVGGRYIYVAIPEYFGEFARRFVQAGVQVVGGCCGTTPDHIRAMRTALDEMGYPLPPEWARAVAARPHPGEAARAEVRAVRVGPVTNEPALQASRVAGDARAIPGSIFERAAGRFVISVELDPPRGPVPQKVVAGARAIREAGADAVNVGDSPMAQVRMSSLATAHLIQQMAGIDVILHFTTRDRNLMGIQADLLGAHALGIRHILALTGDPPGLGNYAHATAVYDVDSIGLVRVLSQLNGGVDVAGKSIGQPTDFVVGVALNPATDQVETELERLRRKLEAGAHFAMTQPLFELEPLLRFYDRLGGCPIPVLLGVLPLRSYQHAEYLHHEVPGISIPQALRDELKAAGERAEQLGMEVALRVAVEAHPYVAGVYVIPSYGRYEQASELVRALRRALAEKEPAQAS